MDRRIIVYCFFALGLLFLLSSITYGQTKPDLTITNVTGPTSVNPETNFSVTVTVRRTGGSLSGSYVRVAVYLSGDSNISKSDINIGSSDNFPVSTLNSSGYATSTINCNSGSILGTFYLGAYADVTEYHQESNENNNTAIASNRITVGYPPNPDLVAVKPFLVTIGNPGQELTRNPKVGEQLYFNFDFRVDKADVTGSFIIRCYLDGQVFWEKTTSNFPVGSYHMSTLEASKSWTATAGSHTVRWVIDTNNQITESNESNNERSKSWNTARQFDLIARSAEFKDRNGNAIQGYVGEEVYFHFKYEVVGEGTTPSFRIRCKLDGSTYYTTSNMTGTAGRSYEIKAPNPWTATSGSHTVEWTIDIDNNIDESNKNNNRASGGYTPQYQSIAAPTNFTAIADGNSVKLSWTDNANNETGFRIERSTNQGSSWSFLKNVNANATSYTDNSVSLERRYDYRIRAYNNDTNSSWVEYFAYTLQAPSSLQATAAAANQVNVTWRDNSNNENGFKLQRRLESSGSWTEYDLSSNRTSYTDYDVTAGTTYYYRIRAYHHSSTTTPHYSSFSNIGNDTPQYPANPKVYVNPSQVHAGQTITESGEGFTPGGLAELHVVRPDGVHYGRDNTWTRPIYGNGRFEITWTPDSNSPIGTYRYWAKDRSSGKSAPEVTFEVIKNQDDVGSIRGGISDDITRAPLTNAKVYLKSGSQTIKSKDVNPISAIYEFKDIPVGTYIVEAQAPVYVPNSRIIEVYNSTQPSEGNITLKKQGSAGNNIAQFISKSLQDGVNMAPGQLFKQTFIFKNIGGNTWRYYTLNKISGHAMGAGSQVNIPETKPSENCEITLDFIAPSSGGSYSSTWQLSTSGGEYFGPEVTFDIKVEAPVVQDNSKFISFDNFANSAELRPGESRKIDILLNNSGTSNWTNYTFEKNGGQSIEEGTIKYNIPPISAGVNANLFIQIKAPNTPGPYMTYWQVKNSSGEFFGDLVTIMIVVVPNNQQTKHENLGSGSESNPNGASSSEPVNLANGNYYYEHIDFAFAGPFGTLFKRTYNAQDNYEGPLGHNWTHNFNTMLAPSESGPTLMRTGDGRASYFKKLSDYDFEAISRVYEELQKNQDGTYTFTFKNGSKQHFSSSGYLTKIEDRNGRTTTCNYDQEGKLTKVTDPAGRSLNFSYDSYNRMRTVSDGARTVSYEYDENGDLTSVIDALGTKTTFVYDSHRIIKIIDPKGQTIVENTYNDDGRCILQKDPLGYETKFQYDIVNGKTIETDPRGYSTEYTFAAVTRLTKVVDPRGYSESYEYDENDNRISITDKNGNTTGFEYNEFGQVTRKIDANGYVTLYNYDEKGNLLSISDDIGTVQELAYNEQGLPVTIKDGKGSITTLEYDQMANLVKREIDGSVWQFIYDLLGRRISTTDPLGNFSLTEYDALGRVIKNTTERGYTTVYDYDENGNRVSRTDPKGNKMSFSYNAKDELVTKVDPLGNVTEYSYDKVGNKISVKDALAKVTRFLYDGSNLVQKKIDPLGHEMQFTYDGNGNRVSVKNARGKTTHYAFDKMNRLITTTDPLGNITRNVYDGRGQLIEVTDANGHKREYEYDGAGNLISETDAMGNKKRYSYHYNETFISNSFLFRCDI